MKKNICALGLTGIIIFLFGCQSVLAQPGMIEGWVKDESGDPLAGASVTIKNKKTGTATDLKGHYKLKLSPGKHILMVSFIGHAALKEKITINKGVTLQRNYTVGEVYKQYREVVVFSPRPKQRMTNDNNSLREDSVSIDTIIAPSPESKELKRIENSVRIKYNLLFATSFNRDNLVKDAHTVDPYLNISRQLFFRVFRKWSLDPRAIARPVIIH